MPRILLIDDDASLLDALSLAFEDADYQVLTAADGQRGLEIVKKEKPDAVISDVNMPGLDGFSLCRKLREGGNGVPLVLLTSRDDEIDEALGLELGADDYVAKPFSTRVLLARVAALLRREAMRAAHQTERAVAKGALELYPERLEVRYAGKPITVTVTEFRLLEALASRAGFVLSRERLLEIVRGDESVVAERIIDTYVRRLRRKIEAVDPQFDRIETVIGAGYRWKDGSVTRPQRRPLPRPSLRINAVLMVLAMLVLPQAIVVGWSAMKRDIGGKLQWSARQTAQDAESALWSAHADGLDGPRTEARLAEVAAQHTARIRVVRSDGTERFDVDRDQGTDLVHQVGTLFFGPDGAPTLREFDETLGPVQKRPEIVKVTKWFQPDSPSAPPPRAPLPEGTARATVFHSVSPPPPSADVETGCRISPAGKLLVCHAVRAVTAEDGREAIYVQESSRRAVRALYDLRYQLLRLSLIMLPFALGFSWWMGRRMVHPIEWLRERVLEKARSANPRADLDPPPGDEVADLANAFNDLLGSLDERRRANEAFIADLVHEFKNPVAAIRTCAETLDSGGVDEKRAARLSKILADSSTRLDVLVSQFLELARAEAGMPNEAREPVDLAALARGVTAAIERGHPDVTFKVDADGPAAVVGVEPRLDSVVRNLVDNAASFAGSGGEVRVTVKPDPDDARQVILEVCDSGPGIPDKDLPRMFERFFTTRAVSNGSAEPSARKQKGTGLGLALVKAVVEAHGGQVSAHSAAGSGATFRVVLPIG